MLLMDLIKILNKDQECALPSQDITIKAYGKILYFGKIKDCKPNKLEGGSGWIVFSYNPDYSKRTKENSNIPDYNLPYIVEVI